MFYYCLNILNSINLYINYIKIKYIFNDYFSSPFEVSFSFFICSSLSSSFIESISYVSYLFMISRLSVLLKSSSFSNFKSKNYLVSEPKLHIFIITISLCIIIPMKEITYNTILIYKSQLIVS